MRTLFNTITNTYRTFKLLSNPRVGEMLSAELNKEIARAQVKKATKDTFYHGHYFVQVMG